MKIFTRLWVTLVSIVLTTYPVYANGLKIGQESASEFEKAQFGELRQLIKEHNAFVHHSFAEVISEMTSVKDKEYATLVAKFSGIYEQELPSLTLSEDESEAFIDDGNYRLAFRYDSFKEGIFYINNVKVAYDLKTSLQKNIERMNAELVEKLSNQKTSYMNFFISDAQAGVLLIGGLLLAGVLLYNKWRTGKFFSFKHFLKPSEGRREAQQDGKNLWDSLTTAPGPKQVEEEQENSGTEN